MTAPKKYRRRYIAFEIKESSQNSKKPNPYEELKQKIDPFPYSWIIEYDREKGNGIIKSDHLKTKKLSGMLEEQKNVTTLGISGTIKKAIQKFLK